MDELLSKANELIEAIVSNPYFGLIGFLVGIVGLLFSYYIAKRDHRYKELYCKLVSNNIISKSKSLFPKLDMKYDDKALNNLTITKVSIKNTGTEVLKMSDVAQADPITFSTRKANGVYLLDFGITHSSDDLCNFAIKKRSENKIRLEFDYIQPKDFVIIQMLHTGKDSNDIDLTGTIIGARKPFVPKETDEVRAARSPLNRFLRSIDSRILTLVTMIAWIISCGLISYAMSTITNSILVGTLCNLPMLIPLWLLYRFMFVKPDRDREILSKDITTSMFGRAFSELDDSSDDTN